MYCVLPAPPATWSDRHSAQPVSNTYQTGKMPKTLPADPCKVPIKRGRPQREIPYVLPPLPSKKSRLATRQKTKQKVTRAVLQNNAASLRYRRSQKLKYQQQQFQLEELFRKNARLHSTQAKLKKAISVIGTQVRQWADQGCAHCLQTSLLLQQSTFPQQPMVKIEPEAFADLKELHCN